MERLIQYLDDIEDTVYAVALLMERVRRFLQTVLLLVASVIFQGLGVLLALSRPPMALAVVCLVTVGMLYRSATGPQPVPAPPQ
jgi:hypothetical protein